MSFVQFLLSDYKVSILQRKNRCLILKFLVWSFHMLIHHILFNATLQTRSLFWKQVFSVSTFSQGKPVLITGKTCSHYREPVFKACGSLLALCFTLYVIAVYFRIHWFIEMMIFAQNYKFSSKMTFFQHHEEYLKKLWYTVVCKKVHQIGLYGVKWP